jgi:ligand-binding SRPBCC domain-containing protein
MRIYVLKERQIVDRPLEQVFEFFSRPENLEAITPDLLRFRILTPTPIDMHPGELIDYELRLSGVPIHWRTLITDWDPPRGFIDQQLKGPYALWHHRHTFSTVEGGTLIEDEVHYALPFGPLGRLVHALYVRRNVAGIFAFRKQVIAREFSART